MNGASSSSCFDGVKKPKLNGFTNGTSPSKCAQRGARAYTLVRKAFRIEPDDSAAMDEDDDGTAADVLIVTRIVSADMVVYCFDVLHAHLTGAVIPRPPARMPNKQMYAVRTRNVYT
jgi:hypothetical protein